MSYRIVLYQSNRGEFPVKDFINSLSPAIHAKYLRLIDLLSENGPFLRMPYCKKITQHLFELRTSGKSPLRVIYVDIKGTYVLLHAFQKKTNKTPTKEIEIADARRLTLI